MNIRKIILKEMDDLDWISDTSPLDEIFNGRVFIDNDTNDKHMVEIQKIMFRYGYKWSGDGDEGEIFESSFGDYKAISSGSFDDYEGEDGDEYIIGYYSNKNGYFYDDKESAERKGDYYKASHILSLYNNTINESDDLDWIKDTQDMFQPGRKYVDTRTDDIIEIVEQMGDTFIIIKTIEKGRQAYPKTLAKLIIERGIWESYNESDDLDWIKDTNPTLLERGNKYVIDLCGQKYYNTQIEESIKNKFVELFGSEIFGPKYRNSFVNWFNNSNLTEDVYLILEIQEKTESNPFGLRGGWNPCTPEIDDDEFPEEYYHETIEHYLKDHTHLTINQFLTSTVNE